MSSLFNKIFGKNTIIVSTLNEMTRDGINKAYIPKFLYKPPFGYPRYANMSYIRYLAQTPYVEMCISTILDEIASMEWDIVPTPGMEDQADEFEIEHIRNFLLNPNTNNETFEEVFIRMPVRDLLEINSGILNKVYNLKEELVEVVARDGATFTKNPDIHGMFTNRDDIIIPKSIIQEQYYRDQMQNPGEVFNPFQYIPAYDARERGAYFQYGWISGPVPVPFGKREIVWIEKMKRTDEIYGYSPIQILAKNIQTLIYMIESDLDYYNDNNVPKGIIGLDDSDSEEIEAFKEQWFETQRTKDDFGNWKKIMHKVPIVNKTPNFTRIEFSAQEMEVIEKQKWYTKIVWASFGVTPTELGYTEDAKGSANQIVQSKTFKKKAIYPILRILESKYNMEIVSEFKYTGYIAADKKKKMEVPKYRFVFKTFDVEEEKAKADLYQVQIDNGLKTVNEIRIKEGDKEVDWGNDPPSKWKTAGTSFNFGSDYSERVNNAMNPKESGNTNQTKEPDDNPKNKEIKSQMDLKSDHFELVNNGKDTEMLRSSIVSELSAISLYEDMSNKTSDSKLKKVFLDVAKEEKVHVGEFEYLLNNYKDSEQKESMDKGKLEVQDKIGKKSNIETKPFAGYSDFDDCVKKNKDKKDPEAYCAVIMRNIEGKEMVLSDVVDEDSESEKDFIESVKNSLRDSEKKFLDAIEQEFAKNTIAEVKDLNLIFEKIKEFFSTNSLKKIISEFVRKKYFEGWNESEKQMERNYIPNYAAIDFLSDYTFKNIKGMTDEIADDLRQALQRSLMNRENLSDIKQKIKEIFETADSRSEMIARTELNRASNYGKLQALQTGGETGKKVWISAYEDGRLCEKCKSLDGQEVDLNSNFKDNTGDEVQAPPLHPHCRCSFAFRPN